MKEKWEALKKGNGNLDSLQERIKAFQEAKKTGDKDLYQQRKADLQQQWKNMSPQERQAIGQQIPELNRRMMQLEGGPAAFNATRTGSDGRAQKFIGEAARKGNTWNYQGAAAGEGGRPVNVTGETSVEGNQAKFQRQWKGPKGKGADVTGTHTKDGNVVTTDKTITGDNGGSTHLNSTSTRAGDTITTVVSTDDGKTVTQQVTGLVDSSGVHTTSTITGPQGQTVQTSGDWMFDFLNESDY
jgi:hypothetical protein